jgi:glycosyltransferase involved in cell wall biosynthesis
MRVAILADGRSPITRGWLSALVARDYQVHLLSTFPCSVDLPLSSQHLVPIAFSGLSRSKPGAGSAAPGGAAAIQLRAAARRWLGMTTFPRAIRRLRGILGTLEIDLLHALRIPYEGMLAAEANPQAPLILSVWGNDFTLHARSTPWMHWLTQRAVTRANGLHADCQRDVRLARDWGFEESLSTLVVPGSGGLDRAVFHRGAANLDRLKPELKAHLYTLSSDTPVVINPRGFRAYVRNDAFFQSIPYILHEFPEAKFLAPSMMGEKTALQWLTRLGIEGSVILLPRLTPQEMAVMYRLSQIMVSPSEHDGTPNTFLEAIACGCYPVVGDLESLREWVEHGVNGSLINPANPVALAEAVVKSLRDPQLRSEAYERNRALIDERAERTRVGEKLDHFYREVSARGVSVKSPSKAKPS